MSVYVPMSSRDGLSITRSLEIMSTILTKMSATVQRNHQCMETYKTNFAQTTNVTGPAERSLAIFKATKFLRQFRVAK